MAALWKLYAGDVQWISSEWHDRRWSGNPNPALTTLVPNTAVFIPAGVYLVKTNLKMRAMWR